MPKVNPVGMLNTKAHNMIAGYITDSPDKHKYAQEFFGFANNYNLQGPAIVSYFSNLHGIAQDINITKHRSSNRVDNLKKFVRDLIAPKEESSKAVNTNLEDEAVKAEAQEFVNGLKKIYGKNLRARFSLADQGAVTMRKPKKTHWQTKMLVRINLLLDKLITKYKPVYKKLYEFCKPVE